MAQFNVRVPHRIGRQAALIRMQPFLDDIRRTYAHEMTDSHREWHGNRLEFAFTARGVEVEGTLVVEDDAVSVSGPLTFAILFFRAQIEETIQQELEKLLL